MRAWRTGCASALALAVHLASVGACVGALVLVAGGGCASAPESSSLRRVGLHHTVRKGENLYRIGQRYGIPVEVIRDANGIHDVTTLSIGQKLWIPAAGKVGASVSLAGRVRGEARKETGVDFSWPVTGKLTSRYGRRGRSPHEGIDIGAPKGTDIRAAEAGKVVHVGRMGDYGKLVIVKHAGNYRSVYAHVNRYHVSEGNFVEKGQRIAEVGKTGNASGPHLHFEIRERDRPRDPMLYLP